MPFLLAVLGTRPESSVVPKSSVAHSKSQQRMTLPTPCDFSARMQERSPPQESEGQCDRGVQPELLLPTSEAGALLRRHNGTTLSFLGDSLVRQLFHMLVCLLSVQPGLVIDAEPRYRYWRCPHWDCVNQYKRVRLRDPKMGLALTMLNKWVMEVLRGPPLDLPTRELLGIQQ